METLKKIIEFHKQTTILQFLAISLGWTLDILGHPLEKQYGSLVKIWLESNGYHYTEGLISLMVFTFSLVLLQNGYFYAYLKWVKEKEVNS